MLGLRDKDWQGRQKAEGSDIRNCVGPSWSRETRRPRVFKMGRVNFQDEGCIDISEAEARDCGAAVHRQGINKEQWLNSSSATFDGHKIYKRRDSLNVFVASFSRTTTISGSLPVSFVHIKHLLGSLPLPAIFSCRFCSAT